MQKLSTLADWRTLQKGEQIALPAEKPRRVRLTVNAGLTARLYIAPYDKPKEAKFLAVVMGLDTIEFVVKGRMTVQTDAEINFRLDEGAQIHVEKTADAKFTEIVERKARNPELEQMMAMAMANSNAMFERLQKESDRKHAAQINALKAEVNATKQPVTASDTSDATEKPEQNTGAGSPGDDTGEAPQSTEPGTGTGE